MMDIMQAIIDELKINLQRQQVTTHADLLTRAERMKNTRQAYSGDVPQHNRNSKGRRGRSGRGRSKGRGREGSHVGNKTSTPKIKDEKAKFITLIKAEHKRRKDNDLCFKCGKSGHRVHECPEKPKNYPIESKHSLY